MANRESLKTYICLCVLPVTVSMWSTAAISQQQDIFSQSFDCVIYPSVVAELGSSVSGVLSSVNVERSQLVKRGDVVAQLESKAEKAALELVQARVDSTLEIDFRQANASHVKRQFTRISETATEDIFSGEELDARKTDANMGQIQLAQAQENKKFLTLELEQAKELLDRRSILSPFDGIVTEQLKFVGEFVDGEAVVRVAQLDPLHIETIVPAEFIKDVVSGMQATISTVTDINTLYNAQVDLVDQVVDVASGTFGVRLSLANPDYAITAGLRCSVHFEPLIQNPAAALPTDESVMEEVQIPVALSLENKSENEITEAVEQTELAAKQTVELADMPAAINECEWPKKFSSEEAAKAEVSTQSESGISFQIAEEMVSVAMGHSVISPKFHDKQTAVEYVESLNQTDVRDVALSSFSGSTIWVSLGAYKLAENAQKRLDYVLQQGVEAQIVPWTENKAEFVVTPEQRINHSKTDCVL